MDRATPPKPSFGRLVVVGIGGLLGAGVLVAGCGLTGVPSKQSSSKPTTTTRKGGVTSFQTVPYQPTTTSTTTPQLASVGQGLAAGDTAATQDSPGSYTVRAGDVAVLIARKNAVTFAELQAANADKDLNKIQPGDVLVIPSPSADGTVVPPVGTPSQTTKAPGATTTAVKSGATYTVVAGDTLVGIAKKIGIQLATLQSLNPTVTAQSLQVGQKLNIPKGGTTATTKASPTTTKA
jgi:LysM repeat protein